MSTLVAPRILVVEDEAEIREIIVRHVHSSLPGAKVSEAENGSDASQKAMNQKFDLVITDINMPRMDGRTFIRSLGVLPPQLRPRGVFVISGHMDAVTAVQEIGAVTFFPKPIDKEKFTRQLRQFFGLSVAAIAPQKVDIAFINPFIEATVKVLGVTCGIEAEKEAVFARAGTQISGDISALIAMNSDSFLGSFAVSFEERCFLAAVGNMLGSEYDQITEEIQDAAAELCNQIFGLAKKDLNEKGHAIQPAIPSVITGPGHRIRHVIDGVCIAVKFRTKAGGFQVEAVLQGRVSGRGGQ